MCGFNQLNVISISTCTLYVGFAKNASVVDISWKQDFSASITEKMTQRASQQLFSLAVWTEWYLLLICLTSEFLLGFYILSLVQVEFVAPEAHLQDLTV